MGAGPVLPKARLRSERQSMRLNVGTDYGLRVLMFLLAEPGGRMQVDRMAEAFAVSANHLNKVVQRLAQGGLRRDVSRPVGRCRPGAAARRDQSGRRRARLSRPISAWSNVSWTAVPSCCLSPACRLRGLVREALDAFLNTFSKYTLADLDASDLKRLLAVVLRAGRGREAGTRRLPVNPARTEDGGFGIEAGCFAAHSRLHPSEVPALLARFRSSV